MFGRRDGWCGTVLVYLIHRLDALLRHLYRIREFTDDPNCLLRLAMKQASTLLSLSDGTRIMLGDPVGELHLWNDHVPHFPSGGPTLGWARRVHALMVHSLSLLADHVAPNRSGRECQPFMPTLPFLRSDHWVRYEQLHEGTVSSLRFGAGLFGVPFTMLLKACCWAV